MSQEIEIRGMGRIIVIDGTSNAGKTTLCENLEKTVQNVSIVPGASLFAKLNSARYPKIPAIPKNAEEEKENQKFFFELELDRLKKANEMAKQGKYIFMDRGVLEILSVAYSFEHINGWKGIYSNARKLYEAFIEESGKNGLMLPAKYIWLQADFKEIVKRNKSRKFERGQALSEDDWIESNLIKKQIDFFKTMMHLPENNDKLKLIDTNNMSKQEVLSEVCRLLNLKFKENEKEINDD